MKFISRINHPVYFILCITAYVCFVNDLHVELGFESLVGGILTCLISAVAYYFFILVIVLFLQVIILMIFPAKKLAGKNTMNDPTSVFFADLKDTQFGNIDGFSIAMYITLYVILTLIIAGYFAGILTLGF